MEVHTSKEFYQQIVLGPLLCKVLGVKRRKWVIIKRNENATGFNYDILKGKEHFEEKTTLNMRMQ